MINVFMMSAYDSHQDVYVKVIGFPFRVINFAQSRLSS